MGIPSNPLKEMTDKIRSKIDPSSQVQSTRDYGIFKKSLKNRTVYKDRRAYKGLLQAVRKRNLLDMHPIIVSADLKVLDGQHRLEVAKELKVPIYYLIANNMTEGDISSINCIRAKWTLIDYLESYIGGGNVEYGRLKLLCEKYDFPITTALQVCSGKQKDGLKGESLAFKEGDFVYPVGKQLETLNKCLERYKPVVDFIIDTSPKKPTFLNNSHFQKGLIRFLNEGDIDFEYFMKNLDIKVKCLHSSGTTQEFKDQFIEIYNYNRKRPLNLGR